MGRVFLGTEAIAAGIVTRHELSTQFDRLYPNVYVARLTDVTAAVRAEAAWLWSRRRAVVSGLSAAALHGALWVDRDCPAELAFGRSAGPPRLVVHQDLVGIGEVTNVGTIPVTSPARTAFDIGRRMRFVQALIHLDSLLRATGLDVAEVIPLLDRHRGARGLVQLRTLLDLADAGAESPPETRTRLTLIQGGLPRPRTQIRVYDEFGFVVARIDMGWDAYKVGVEFDGAQHWTDSRQRTRDIDRTAELEARGWRLIRVSSDMLRNRPDVIVERVRTALILAGWCPQPVEETITQANRGKRPA